MSLEKNYYDKADINNKGTLKGHGLAAEDKDILDDVNWQEEWDTGYEYDLEYREKLSP